VGRGAIAGPLAAGGATGYAPRAMDLHAHSLRALDWPAVCARLADHAATLAGARAAADLPLCADRDAVLELHAAVAEVRALAEEALTLPFGGVLDVVTLIDRARVAGAALDRDELREVLGCVAALDRLRGWVVERAARAPRLAARAAEITVGAELVRWAGVAFEADGSLSGEAFPAIGALRARIDELGRGIRDELDRLLRSDELATVLQDKYITEREGRYVLPLKASVSRTFGIVHGTSNTGETVYMEPAQVVARSNRLREARSELEREERRALVFLTALVAQDAAPLRASLGAAVELDLVSARALLGDELRGITPEVGRGGTLRLLQARHPLLALRGVQVVPNDLHLDGARRGLVLTGPNTGGKTIALKTLGLCALLVRAGVPVPCAEGSRVDVFPVVAADIGDIQTVSGDLSTFSGHLTVLREVLAQAGPGTLALLDELGVGTDPAQGAALARALIEALVDAGCRVAVTTHAAEIKAIAADDPRVAVAGMQVAHGRPTWRIEPGMAGSSHALAAARRLGLPDAVLRRAEALLDAGTRQLTGLVEALETARGEAAELQARLDADVRALEARERRLAAREAQLEQRRAALQSDVAGGYAARLREREAEVKALIAALQADPSLHLAGRTLRQLRDERDAVGRDLRPALPPAPPAPPAPGPLVEGDAVWITALGRRGVLVKDLGRDRVEVDLGGPRMKLRRDEISRVGPAPRPAVRAAAPAPAPAPAPVSGAPAGPADREALQGLRTEANTLDLRGRRVEEALEQIAPFLDRVAREGRPVAYLLHGHGTGAMKAAVREWLRESQLISAWRPCDVGEGGDAYTIVGIP